MADYSGLALETVSRQVSILLERQALEIPCPDQIRPHSIPFSCLKELNVALRGLMVVLFGYFGFSAAHFGRRPSP